MQNSNILILAISVMDFITALFVIFDPHPLVVARLGIFYQLFTPPIAGALLMLAAVCLAFFGIFKPIRYRWRFVYFLPQHAFLLLTTGSAVNLIMQQHYADGVMRPWQFILQDQLPIIILTFAYAFAMFDFYKGGYGRKY